MSELIQPTHLARKAIIYIRQSSPHQVLSNQESLRLQYALQQRALDLGWQKKQIEIIDADLGITGSSAQPREGYKEIVSQVSLGQVGIILSYEVQRLSRNCSDWYPLLDICAYKSCLIADSDGIYDPASANGRLLLGLKGQLSELELHTIRMRMTAGLLNKAERGELALALPVGLIRDELGQVLKDPNQEIQARLELVFTTFFQAKSASKVLQYFNHHHLSLPRRDRFGDLYWKKPTVAAILEILKNPAYAGAFVYGRTRTTRHPSGKTSTVRLPIDQWRIRINDKYPAYVSWERFEKIQAMLKDNYAEYDRNQSRGVPRPGSALLQGLGYCGECGHKLVVQYKGGTRYLCNYLRQQHGVPVCQHLPGDAIDACVVEAFFQALSPVELNVYTQSIAAQAKDQETIDRAHRQQLERLRYEAALAQRQFNHVDPDNRLVAAELEKRWETALRALKQAEDAQTQHQPTQRPQPALSPELKAAFSAIGQQLPQVWDQDVLTHQQKKALLRCLIDKVVAHRTVRDRVQVRIVWKGGDTTTIDLPIPVGSLAELSTDLVEMETLILTLNRQGKTDAEIAEHLTTLGHRSPMKPDCVLPSTVRTIRLKHGQFLVRSQSHPRSIPGYLTMPQLAKTLDVSPHWLYDRINNGRIQIPKDTQTGLYLFPDTPETIEQFQKLKSGILKTLHFSKEHQDV
jgi:DNA invertase Pin-like site-specific DNA recombinase/predicted DNA-binding transcriptional regulator AlpA